MKKRRRLKPWVFNFMLFLIFCGVCSIIYYSYKIYTWKHDVEDNNKIQKIIEESIITIDDNGTENSNDYIIDFAKLKEQNSDTIAYLKVNNTNIDYIVVRANDNSYYLNHNFNKHKNSAGWIFSDYKNKFDGSDRNIIIYGHNTKDGSMFGTLINILDNSWQESKDNLEITLITEKGQYKYQVFSTYSITPEDYYINTEFKNNDEFDKFIKNLKSRSVYDYDVEVSKEDKILTLSSCIGDGSKRVVLHSKLIEVN